MVAKNPNFMAGGSLSFVYRVKDDSLWMTLKSPHLGRQSQKSIRRLFGWSEKERFLNSEGL